MTDPLPITQEHVHELLEGFLALRRQVPDVEKRALDAAIKAWRGWHAERDEQAAAKHEWLCAMIEGIADPGDPGSAGMKKYDVLAKYIGHELYIDVHRSGSNGSESVISIDPIMFRIVETSDLVATIESLTDDPLDEQQMLSLVQRLRDTQPQTASDEDVTPVAGPDIVRVRVRVPNDLDPELPSIPAHPLKQSQTGDGDWSREDLLLRRIFGVMALLSARGKDEFDWSGQDEGDLDRFRKLLWHTKVRLHADASPGWGGYNKTFVIQAKDAMQAWGDLAASTNSPQDSPAVLEQSRASSPFPWRDPAIRTGERILRYRNYLGDKGCTERPPLRAVAIAIDRAPSTVGATPAWKAWGKAQIGSAYGKRQRRSRSQSDRIAAERVRSEHADW